ncbi:hypothetical protein HN51_069440 [Arachis hypogaea]
MPPSTDPAGQHSTTPVTPPASSVSDHHPVRYVHLLVQRQLDPVQKLCSGGCDNTVKVWKLNNGFWKMDCFPALQMHTDWVRDVAWAPNLGNGNR